VTDAVNVSPVIAPTGTGTLSVIAVASEVSDDFSLKGDPFCFCGLVTSTVHTQYSGTSSD
jgi:hypothetical protein